MPEHEVRIVREDGFTAVGGIRIHYEAWGAGDPVGHEVLQPGIDLVVLTLQCFHRRRRVHLGAHRSLVHGRPLSVET